MNSASVFEVKINLPTAQLDAQAQNLLGFDERYLRVKNRLQLILQANGLERWSETHHKKKIFVIK
jgi:hypothetical protein